MKREFWHTHSVRYDECNCHGSLTPSAFLRYMQDIAARDAENAQLAGNGFWVVKRTIMEFHAPVRVHTPLALKTFGIGFSRITAQRGYEVYIAGETAGEAVLSARTLWVYIDPRGRPVRLPERTGEIWLPDGPLPQQPEAAFPPFPDSEPAVASYGVHFSAIDPMRHLNNASAVEMLDDAGWEAYAREGITPETAQMDILRYDIDYVHSPRFEDRLEIQTWLAPFPALNAEFSQLQQMTQAGKVMVRAHSRRVCRRWEAGRWPAP